MSIDPTSRDLRDALRRHIPSPASSEPATRLSLTSTGDADVGDAYRPAPCTITVHAHGPERAGGGASPLRGMGWRTRIAIVVVAVFLAGGVLAGLTALGGI